MKKAFFFKKNNIIFPVFKDDGDFEIKSKKLLDSGFIKLEEEVSADSEIDAVIIFIKTREYDTEADGSFAKNSFVYSMLEAFFTFIRGR